MIGGLIVSGRIYSQELGLDDILKRAELKNEEVIINQLNSQIKEKAKNKAFKDLVLRPINFTTEQDLKNTRDEGVGIEKIEATITLFQGGKLYNKYGKSKIDYALSKKNKKLSIYRAQEKAVREYFNSLNYREQFKITEGAIKALIKQKNRLEGLYKTGKLVPKSEVLKIEADIENNKAINMGNYQREKNSIETLYKILGYSLDSNIFLKNFDGKEYLKTLGLLEKPIKDPKETTLGVGEQLKVESAKYDLKIAKGDLYPTIYLRPIHRFKDEKNGRYGNVNEGEIEFGFSYTFSWGGTLDEVKQKEYALDQAKVRYINNIKGIALSMRNKYREIDTLYGQNLASKKRVKLLGENLEIDTLRYDNDLITTFDYLNSVNELKKARENYYKIQRELVITIIEYKNLYR